VWEPEDVIDVYASMFREGEEYTYIEVPTAPHGRGVLSHADHVLKDGKRIGVSSGTVYSYHYRKMISLCSLDIEHAKQGNDVTVQWGDHGKRIKTIRAKIDRFPYLNEGRNQDIDTAAVPVA
jgi:vanillate/3-O-methylgallate O-demethylase